METITLCYILTNFEQAIKYTDNTMLFTLGESRLTLYKSLETALKAMPDHHGISTKAPVVVKFEIPDVSEPPNNLNCAFLTQLGYKENILKYTIVEKRKRPPTELFQRVSFVQVDKIKTDLSEKVRYIEALATYKQRVERYTESQTEMVDAAGYVDAEFIDLTSISYEPLLGGRPGECKDDIIIREYGLTKDEYDLIDQTRGTVTEMGITFAEGLAKLGDRQIIVSGTDGLGDIGIAMQRFLKISQALKERGAVLTRGGQPVSLEEHAAALSLMAGINPDDIIHILRNPPRLQDG